MEKLYEFNIADADDRNKIYQRKVDCERIAKELRKNADKAYSQGNVDLAQQMRERAAELDKLASSFNGKAPEPGTAQGGNGGFGDETASGNDLLRKLVEQAKKRGPEACRAVRKVLSEIPESKISSSSKVETNTPVKNESLQEGIDLSRSLRDWSDDEFSDLLDSSIDLIDKVSPKDVKRSTKDEVNIKIQQTKSNNNALSNKAISAEEANILRKNIQQVNAREAEKNKYTSLPGFDRFKLNLYNTVRDQVAAVRQEYQDYSEVNAEYEGEDIIMKADVMKDIPDEAIPSIDIYIDRSGSWGSDDKLRRQAEMIGMLKDFDDRGEINLNIFYFKSVHGVGHIYSESVAADGGTYCWKAIVDNILATKPKNVIIMTDSDMFCQGDQYITLKVPGVVWWLWWHDSNFKILDNDLITHLIGRSGNHEYLIS